jgi:hypothetical protein
VDRVAPNPGPQLEFSLRTPHLLAERVLPAVGG